MHKHRGQKRFSANLEYDKILKIPVIVVSFSEACSRREICVCGAEGGRGAQAAAAPPREREGPAEIALCAVQQ